MGLYRFLISSLGYVINEWNLWFLGRWTRGSVIKMLIVAIFVHDFLVIKDFVVQAKNMSYELYKPTSCVVLEWASLVIALVFRVKIVQVQILMVSMKINSYALSIVSFIPVYVFHGCGFSKCWQLMLILWLTYKQMQLYS